MGTHHRRGGSLKRALVIVALFVLHCRADDPRGSLADGAPSTGPPISISDLCSAPGSVTFDDNGAHVVPGAEVGASDLSWLTLPPGFCAHRFTRVPTARQIRFAPGGELFVASPSTPTTGGGKDGMSAIVAVPDDNHDGVGDTLITYMNGKGSTQGLLFFDGWLYYQDGTRISRVAYAPGQRTPAGASEVVTDIRVYVSVGHWPKALDVADDGTIYVANGGDQTETCDPARPFHGGILALDGTPGGRPIVRGLRNPIAIRCQRGHNHCFANELSLDYSEGTGGREKLIPIRAGDDWGYPCCATKDLPYGGVTPVPDCSGVAAETNSFVIGDTPFGFDFVPSTWPPPWRNRVMVTLHGVFGTWAGARVVAIATDPATGLPIPSSTTLGGAAGAIADFATGWDDGSLSHGRPADAAFAPDGRLFIADDVTGVIFWVAPVPDQAGARDSARID